jgi:hypothetical protein
MGTVWPAQAVAVAILILGATLPAVACTALLRPIEQILRESEAIVRAQVVAAEPGRGADAGRVTLRVQEVVKGEHPGLWVTVAGRLADYRAPSGRTPPYAEIDCVGRTPGCASCFARSYAMGRQYLLLLKGGTPYWAPLSPTNEEVSGPGDPWITWVRRKLAP